MAEKLAVKLRRDAARATLRLKAEKIAGKIKAHKQLEKQRQEFAKKIEQMARIYVRLCMAAAKSAAKNGKYTETVNCTDTRNSFCDLRMCGKFPLLGFEAVCKGWDTLLERIQEVMKLEGVIVELKEERQEYENDGFPCVRSFWHLVVRF